MTPTTMNAARRTISNVSAELRRENPGCSIQFVCSGIAGEVQELNMWQAQALVAEAMPVKVLACKYGQVLDVHTIIRAGA